MTKKRKGRVISSFRSMDGWSILQWFLGNKAIYDGIMSKDWKKIVNGEDL